MADPFSIVTGATSLVDVLWRCGKYLKHIHESVGKIDEDIAALSEEIDALILVDTSIQNTFSTRHSGTPSSTSTDLNEVSSLWRNVGALLNNCRTTIDRLEGVLQTIIGNDGSSKSLGKFDALKKTLRKDKKVDEFKDLRLQLMNYKNSLQLLLTALNISYTRSSHDSTDLSLRDISRDVQLLQSQITSLHSTLTVTNDHQFLDAIERATAVASRVSINKHFDIPQAVSSIFTGRDSLLEDLRVAFDVVQLPTKPTNVQRRFIVYGLGGSGKTQFCCKFAQDNRNHSPQTAEHSFSKIAKIGGVEPSEGSNQRAAKEWLSNLEDSWLLLIDNADDSDYPLEKYFPKGERGCILVTTRVPANKVHGTVGSQSSRFEQLAYDEANDLLLKAAGQPSPWDIATRKSADRIADVLGFLPLALVHAGKAILHGLCSLANYIDYYHSSWERIRVARRKFGYKGDEEANINVYASYEIPLRSLEESRTQEAADAIQLLKMFSFLHFENINADILIKAAMNPRIEREQGKKDLQKQGRVTNKSRPKAPTEYLKGKVRMILEYIFKDRGPPILPALLRQSGPDSSFDEPRLRRALKVLSQMSLITFQEKFDKYSMHPLVHTWVRERSEMTVTEQALWCQATKTLLTQCIILPPHGSSEVDAAIRRSLLPHINHVRQCEVSIDTKIQRKQELRSLPWAWLPVPEMVFGRRQALENAKFSYVYFECGLWKEAERLQVAVKDFVFENLGIDDPRTMAAMLFLSGTYFNQARHNEAAELQYQVCQAAMRSLGPDHPKTHKFMDTLGSSRCFQGRFKESLELHEQAIDGMKRTQPANPEDLFIAMDNLGRVLWRYFRYEEAKKVQMEAMEGLKKTLGPTHLQTLVAMEDLALSYLDCGESLYQDARELMLEVLDQRRNRLGKEQPFTLLAISNLARVESAIGNVREAENMFLEIIPVAERTLGEDHFGTLAGKVHYAQVLVRQKRYVEAEDVLTKVVEKQRYLSAARDDGEHPDRIFALWQLVQCYEAHGNIEDALSRVTELEQSIRTIGGQGLGTLHPFAKRLQAKRTQLEAVKEMPQDYPKPADSEPRESATEAIHLFGSTDTLINPSSPS